MKTIKDLNSYRYKFFNFFIIYIIMSFEIKKELNLDSITNLKKDTKKKIPKPLKIDNLNNEVPKEDTREIPKEDYELRELVFKGIITLEEYEHAQI